MRVKVKALRVALIATGRNDLAEQLDAKYFELHAETRNKLRGNYDQLLTLICSDGIFNWPGPTCNI